jgi:NAD(P)-dependent dehydrogenase (short-subunit alcohol dehydrogenase family)
MRIGKGDRAGAGKARRIVIVMPVRNQAGGTCGGTDPDRHGNNDVTVMSPRPHHWHLFDFAEAFKQKYQRLDVLINNAGGYNAMRRSTTVDGMEMTFETHERVVGPFVLTNELLDLSPPSRHASSSSLSSTAGELRQGQFRRPAI